MAELRLEALGRQRARRHHGAFLSGGAGREEPPALRSARILILLAGAILLSALAWAAFAKIERFASAPAVLVNPAIPLVLSHPEGGRIGALLVAAGAEVEEGRALLELVDAELREEEERTAQAVAAAALEVARLKSELSGSPFEPPAEAAALRPELATLERRLLEARRQAEEARAAAVEQELREAERTAEALSRRLAEEESSLGLLDRQIAALAGLARTEDARLQRLALEWTASQERAAFEERKLAHDDALGRAEGLRLKVAIERQEREAALLEALRQAERDLERETARRAAVREKRAGLVIRAPQAGLVQELAVKAIGQTVQPGEPLARLLPRGGDLRVEARLPEEARTDIRPGQEAVLRTKAGPGAAGLRARVVEVGGEPLAEPGGGGGYFPVRLELLDPVEGERALLLAGGAAEVDIRLPEQSPLWFLLRPLLETLNSARRE